MRPEHRDWSEGRSAQSEVLGSEKASSGLSWEARWEEPCGCSVPTRVCIPRGPFGAEQNGWKGQQWELEPELEACGHLGGFGPGYWLSSRWTSLCSRVIMRIKKVSSLAHGAAGSRCKLLSAPCPQPLKRPDLRIP